MNMNYFSTAGGALRHPRCILVLFFVIAEETHQELGILGG
jgi:hypothetical protein